MASVIREREQVSFSHEAHRAQSKRLVDATERGPLRILRAAYHGFDRHNVLLWASGLTYTTSLALVPILAVALSVLKGFSGESSITPLIQHYIAVDSPEIAHQLLGFVSNVDAGQLGAIGGATLLFTVVLTLSTIEWAFNHIFNAPRGRTWIRKFTDYLSLIFTLPLLMAAAVSLRLRLNLPDMAPLGWILATVPLWLGFSFLYLIFPNTRVRWDSALMGGLFTAVLLEVGQWGYFHFQFGFAHSQKIYGALAAIPIFLTWIYIAWVIVLAGAEIAAAEQGAEPAFAADYRSGDFARIAGLLTVMRAGERMRSAKPGICTARSIAGELNVPEPAVQSVIDRLREAGLLHEVASESGQATKEPAVLLSRDSNVIPVAEVIAALGEIPEDTDPALAALLKDLRIAEQHAVASLTVSDLIRNQPQVLSDLHDGPHEWRLEE